MIKVVRLQQSDIDQYRTRIIDVLIAAFASTKMVMDQTSAANLFARISAKDADFIIAEKDDVVCGVSTGMLFTDEILGDSHFANFRVAGANPGDYYFSIAGVDPQHRKTGAAAYLLRAQRAIAAGRVGWARTWIGNEPVIKTLPRAGFQIITTLDDRIYFRRPCC